MSRARHVALARTCAPFRYRNCRIRRVRGVRVVYNLRVFRNRTGKSDRRIRGIRSRRHNPLFVTPNRRAAGPLNGPRQWRT